MVQIEYANAYSEVLELLKYVSRSDYDKIPQNMIELFNQNCNPEYVFEYDMKQSLEEQGVSELARTIIAILFRDYWATEVQKEKIISYQKSQRIKDEEEKSQKYKYEDLFISDKKIEQDVTNNEANLIIYKENIFQKIIHKIRKFFKK